MRVIINTVGLMDTASAADVYPPPPSIVEAIVNAMTWSPMTLDVAKVKATWDGISCDVFLGKPLAIALSKRSSLRFWEEDFAGEGGSLWKAQALEKARIQRLR